MDKQKLKKKYEQLQSNINNYEPRILETITSQMKIIQGAEVEVITKSHRSGGETSIGSNCPMGGDSGHGGITYYKFLFEGNNIEFIIKGDWEALEIQRSFEFASTELKRILCGD